MIQAYYILNPKKRDEIEFKVKFVSYKALKDFEKKTQLKNVKKK